jgi:hypothetical protein
VESLINERIEALLASSEFRTLIEEIVSERTAEVFESEDFRTLIEEIINERIAEIITAGELPYMRLLDVELKDFKWKNSC